MDGLLAKIGTLVAVIVGVGYFVNGSALTPILKNIVIDGIDFLVISNLMLVITIPVGAVVVWRKGDQPPFSKKSAEQIALVHIQRGYPDGQQHRIFSKLTKLEGREWRVYGSFLASSRQTDCSIWVDTQNGEVTHMSF